ncbi:CDP-alcohol phosphatidyltransferase family protein [Sphingomonas quercus]|uniref:CDP-alcohol phosphatidyltransferase family protein n=1 Tax=Sphingomonas quercus TaxID=2842451 RepID=A0ABS6BKD0_9SPHN|nr:CDP-alcohol phosphatidyltransferase family protein [Sphingomonas quercus]MBU3077680.1 CDP-alcohol phosphatidyltransferase family protein [Sphingomonas quercus]
MTETPERIQRNVLAVAERRLLTWLCGRMPSWVTPDRLTSLGMVGSVMVFVGYAASEWAAAWLWLAIFGYLVHWFGDSMDGSLARFRRVERPNYGYFLDHSCDGVATVLIIGGIGCSPFVRLDVALFAAIGYLLLSVHAYLAAKVCGELKLSYLAAGPTELRLMLIGLTLAMLLLDDAPDVFGQMSGFDVFVGVAGAVLVLLFLNQSILTCRRLAPLEP